MEAKPLLKHGWARALLFAVTFLVLLILSNIATDLLAGVLFGKEAVAAQKEVLGVLLVMKFSVYLLVSVITVYFFRKLIDKKDLVSLGLQLKNYLSHAAVGCSLALLLLSIGTFILIAGNNLQGKGLNFDASDLVTGCVVMILIAFAEELAFRGYILNNLMLSMDKWMALICSALLFAVFHLSNAGVGIIAFLNVFIAGVLLGINYIFTKNLWYGTFFHFAWNLYQGPVLGFKVSGIGLKSLFEQDLNGNDFLTGGSFGFEGSVIAGSLSLLAVLLLAWIYNKKYGQLIYNAL